jgi:hypothetical protein
MPASLAFPARGCFTPLQQVPVGEDREEHQRQGGEHGVVDPGGDAPEAPVPDDHGERDDGRVFRSMWCGTTSVCMSSAPKVNDGTATSRCPISCAPRARRDTATRPRRQARRQRAQRAHRRRRRRAGRLPRRPGRSPGPTPSGDIGAIPASCSLSTAPSATPASMVSTSPPWRQRPCSSSRPPPAVARASAEGRRRSPTGPPVARRGGPRMARCRPACGGAGPRLRLGRQQVGRCARRGRAWRM